VTRLCSQHYMKSSAIAYKRDVRCTLQQVPQQQHGACSHLLSAQSRSARILARFVRAGRPTAHRPACAQSWTSVPCLPLLLPPLPLEPRCWPLPACAALGRFVLQRAGGSLQVAVLSRQSRLQRRQWSSRCRKRRGLCRHRGPHQRTRFWNSRWRWCCIPRPRTECSQPPAGTPCAGGQGGQGGHGGRGGTAELRLSIMIPR